MIERLWHGWTAREDADAYERLLTEEIFPGVAEQNIDGFRGARVLRRDGEETVEFVTAMQFESVEAVKEFAGEEYERAHVPPEARELLTRFDDHADHFERREQIEP